MLKKLLLVSAMAMSMNANALVLNVSGVDVNGASLDKTTIINLPSQSTIFDFFGSLDLIKNYRKAIMLVQYLACI